ncbi:MAG: cyclodeaminase/cyclohydrolase family protein [Oscillospiraceae bacterium]|nr:cyclodeaminase/cyclohydrolase family protein [Oscillospiraceae bacterium]
MENSFTAMTVDTYSQELASKAPVPGGGGAAAVCGALACALGCMVGNLTIGKAKYAANEPRLRVLGERAEALRRELLLLSDADAAAFAPLSKAYGLPKDDPAREETLERCLLAAAEPPMEILRRSCEMIRLSEEYAALGSVLLLSDAGCAATLAAASAKAAALNVQVNTRLMKNRSRAQAMDRELESLLAEALPLADKVYRQVAEALK